MKTVNIHEAKTHLSSLISTVERNKEAVIICKHGVPVAELCPIKHGKRIKVHSDLKDIKILYNPTDSTEDEWNNV